MPKSIEAPAVTDSLVPEGTHLESVESPTDDHINSLDLALQEAGVFENPPANPPTIDPPVVDPPAESTPDAPELTPEVPEASKLGADTLASPAPPSDEPDKKAIEELESLDLDAVKPPENVSPRNLVNFDKLRNVAKHFKEKAARVDELQQELEKAKATAVPDEVLKELEDHRKFRKIFDTENDPEFNAQFQGKISSIDEDVLSILKRNGLPESVEAEMKQVGIDKISLQWWENAILPKLPFVERERITKRLAERADVVEQRSKELERFASQRDEVLQERDAKLKQQFDTENQEIFQHLETMVKDVPWAKPVEITPKMTAAERKAAEDHNRGVEELHSHFQQALYPKSAKERAEVAAAAAASTRFARAIDILSRQLEELTKDRDHQKAELEKIKRAGKLPGKAAPLNRGPSDQLAPSLMSSEDAIERGLEEAESN